MRNTNKSGFRWKRSGILLAAVIVLLAGAVGAAGGDWRGELSYHRAPYGVAYFVANWERS